MAESDHIIIKYTGRRKKKLYDHYSATSVNFMMVSLLYLFCYLVYPFAVSTNVAIEQKLERQIMKDLQFKCINYIFQNEKDIKEKFGSNIFANYVTVIFLPKDKGNIRKNKFGYFYVTAKSIMEGYQQVNSLG